MRMRAGAFSGQVGSGFPQKMRPRKKFNFAPVALAASLAATTGLARGEGDKALGQYLSSECVTCHQVTGRYEGIPPIVGWPDTIFIEIMGEYRAKKRANPIMHTIAVRLSEEEIAALAAYFGSLRPAN
jgi:cytochrome c553